MWLSKRVYKFLFRIGFVRIIIFFVSFLSDIFICPVLFKIRIDVFGGRLLRQFRDRSEQRPLTKGQYRIVMEHEPHRVVSS